MLDKRHPPDIYVSGRSAVQRSNGPAERGIGIGKEKGRRNIAASGLEVRYWPWDMRHWASCEWAFSFEMPMPLPSGKVVMVREKEWQLKNAFQPRMRPGKYLGPEDVDSISAGHLILMATGEILRVTTFHPSEEPLDGLKAAAAERGWSCEKKPDGRSSGVISAENDAGQIPP